MPQLLANGHPASYIMKALEGRCSLKVARMSYGDNNLKITDYRAGAFAQGEIPSRRPSPK
jgi:hypothetical protein